MKRSKIMIPIITLAFLGLFFMISIKTYANNYQDNNNAPTTKFLNDNWECMDDEPDKEVYRICNYLPLNPGNYWDYNTGNRFVLDEIIEGDSGYSGILYATKSYEFSPYMQNHKHGFMWNGATITDFNTKDERFMDIGTEILFIPPEMKIGDNHEVSSVIFGFETYMNMVFVGTETIKVEAGTFDTIKFEIFIEDKAIDDDEYCNYKTTLWFSKGIGIVKIKRTEADPWDCDGCILICAGDDIERLNTPAELVSYNISNDDSINWGSVYQNLFFNRLANLDTFRQFRDDILRKSPAGQNYVNRLYDRSHEVALILVQNRRIMAQAISVSDQLVVEVEYILRGEPGYLSRALLDEIHVLLDAMHREAGPRLKRLIKDIEKDLKNPDVLYRFGIQKISD